MRGAEGLASAAAYAFFRDGKDLVLPFYRDCALELDGFRLKEETNYPFDPEHGEIVLTVERPAACVKALRLREPFGGMDYVLEINGETAPAVFEGGFLRIGRKFRAGDTVRLRFALMPTLTALDSPEGDPSVQGVGPLLYGTEGDGPATPVYHLLDPKVSRESGYSKVIIR